MRKVLGDRGELLDGGDNPHGAATARAAFGSLRIEMCWIQEYEVCYWRATFANRRKPTLSPTGFWG